MQKIYCVEDDQNIRDLIVYALNSSGYKAYGFCNSIEFFDALENQLPNLVLLDIMLPGDDGITILKNLRTASRTKKLPVILLTAKSTEYDKIAGLENGC